MLTFLDELFIFSFRVVGLFHFFFSFSVGGVDIVVESEELNDAGNVDDGYEHPEKHPFVEE